MRTILSRGLSILLAVAGSAWAQCPMRYQQGAPPGSPSNANVATQNVGVTVTEVKFLEDASFVVAFQPKVPQNLPRGYQVGGQMRLQVEMPGIGYAFGCMPLPPGSISSAAKAYRFKIVGIPGNLLQPGLLPAGTYSAEVTLALAVNGRFYRDANSSDDIHALSASYQSELRLTDPVLARSNTPTGASFKVKATNGGKRSTGPLKLRWRADGVLVREANADPIAGNGGSRELSYAYARVEKEAELEVLDSLGNNLAALGAQLEGTTPPPDPNAKTIDYEVSKPLDIVQQSPNVYVLSAKVRNVGKEKPKTDATTDWAVTPQGGPINIYQPVIAPLDPGAQASVSAEVDLNGLDAEAIRKIEGTLRIALAGDEDPENNVSTGSSEPSGETPGAEPPRIKGGPIERSELADPEFAGEPGIGSLHLRLRNDGGKATKVTYRVSVASGDVELPKNKDGTLENLDRVDESDRGLIKLEGIRVQPAAYGKTHRVTVTGTTRYLKTANEEADGPAFTVAYDVPVGAYPKPDLVLSVVYGDATNPESIRANLCERISVVYEVSNRREGGGNPIPFKPETKLKVVATLKKGGEGGADLVSPPWDFTAKDLIDGIETKEDGGTLNCRQWRQNGKQDFEWSATLTVEGQGPAVEEASTENNRRAITLKIKNPDDCPDPAEGQEAQDGCVQSVPADPVPGDPEE